MMELIDSHCHLDFDAFSGCREELLENCAEMGIVCMVVPGVSSDNWSDVAALASRWPSVAPAIGIHPWFLSVAPPEDQLARLQDVLRSGAREWVAIGEIGVDGVVEHPISVQLNVFERQLGFAKDYSKPVILHIRKAVDKVRPLLKKHGLPRGGVWHGFSGSYEQAKQLVDLGYHIGVGGVITYTRAHKTIAAIRKLPLDSLILETDAPSMPVSGQQGRPNTPESIVDVLRALAEIRAESAETLAQATTRNSKKLFDL